MPRSSRSAAATRPSGPSGATSMSDPWDRPASPDPEPPLAPRRVAVAIPCFNEAAAIAEVVARWRAALPEAEVVVFDNNSTDGTGAIARGAGARVVEVADQGKGYAVRAIFDE